MKLTNAELLLVLGLVLTCAGIWPALPLFVLGAVLVARGRIS